MRILVLGGTKFVGLHIVEVALSRGHDVTLFNRGQTNPDMFPDVEKIIGDRRGDLNALKGRNWDAVSDPSNIPLQVRSSIELLAGVVDHYTFVSSVGAYGDVGDVGVDENWKLAELADESFEEVVDFGGQKTLCEKIVQDVMPDRTLIYRPGLIVGPNDPTDRFTYWVRRVETGGMVLAPGYPERSQQIIDVRDLAAWNVHMLELNATGIYNIAGPDYELTMGRMLEEIKLATNSNAEFLWVDGEFLVDQNEHNYEGMPPWLEDPLGVLNMNCAKAIKSGLTFRPISETILASLEWDVNRRCDDFVRCGPTYDEEQVILNKWHGLKI